MIDVTVDSTVNQEKEPQNSGGFLVDLKIAEKIA